MAYMIGSGSVSKRFEPIPRWNLPEHCPNSHVHAVGVGSDEANARAEHDMIRAYIVEHIPANMNPSHLYDSYWEKYWSKWGVEYQPINIDVA